MGGYFRLFLVKAKRIFSPFCLLFLLTFSMNVLTSWVFLSVMALAFSVGPDSRSIVARRPGEAKPACGAEPAPP